MALKDTKFDAFISYRHTELDKFVAETLHKKLEAFRLPASVRRKNKLSKDRIRRVFRDRDELPLASSLAEQITDALQNSEYLIVVCTPRLPQSQWCLKEIDTFIELHGRENIYAILAEGEPSDSFPPQLLYDEKTKINADGVAETVRIPVEPLAADVRGANKNEIRKKMNDELLRLVAPMFGLNYDDLKQRHREQKLKRIVSFSLAISLIFLVFGIFSSVLSLKIQQQADEIYEQNLLISDKNDEITAQATLLQEQNVDLQKSYAVSMASEANTLIHDGRRLDALYALRSSMPDSLSDTTVPHTPQAQKALTDILQIYKTSNIYFPTYNYDVQSPVTSIKVSPDSQKILIQDHNYNLTLWEIDANSPMQTFNTSSNLYENIYAFYDDNIIIYDSPQGVCLYDITIQETSVLRTESSAIYTVPGGNGIILLGFQTIVNVDLSGNIKWEQETYDYDILATTKLAFSENGQYFAVFCYQDIHIFQTDTGELIKSIPNDMRDSVTTHGNYLYCFNTNVNPNFTTLYCYDLSTGDCLWQQTYDNILFSTITFCQPEDVPYIIADSYNECYSIDAATGELLYNAQTDSTIRTLTTSRNKKVVVAMLYDGSIHIFFPENGELYTPDFLNSYIPTTSVKTLTWASNMYFLEYEETARVTAFAPLTPSDDCHEICEMPYGSTLNDSGEIYLTTDYENAYFYYVNEDTPFRTEPLENYECRFVADGSEYFMLYNNSECNVYRFTEDEPCYTVNTTEYFLFYTSQYIREMKRVDGQYVYTIHSLYNLGTTYEFIDDELDFDTKELCLCENSSIYAVIYDDQGIITFKDFNDSNVQITINTTLRTIKHFTFSDDGKYFFVEHVDGTLEIYETTTGNLKKTHYNMSSMLYNVEYIESRNVYFLYGEYPHQQYCINADLEIIAHIPTLLHYSEEMDSMFCYASNLLYTLPFYSYDELIEMTDAILGDYEPSPEICQKYNIN